MITQMVTMAMATTTTVVPDGGKPAALCAGLRGAATYVDVAGDLELRSRWAGFAQRGGRAIVLHADERGGHARAERVTCGPGSSPAVPNR